ncbi:MAG: FAD-dependent oxidoreductase, partial [Clostridium sp.]|nr:FAD-dependent oxidoreductase [Clostridium sp.]
MSLGAEVEVDTVVAVKKNDDGTIAVKTEYSDFTARALIIATGLKHKRLGVENEERFIGNGISFCALCDGNFYKNRDVAVIGGGNTAVQDAIYLSKICSRVYLIHRRDRFRAEQHVVDGLAACENVEQVMNSRVIAINGDKHIESITVMNTESNGERVLEVSGIFAAVGQEPSNQAFGDLVELDSAGFVVAGESCTTREPNVFVAGDCRTKTVRQLVTAGADGGVAAIAACEYLDRQEK